MSQMDVSCGMSMEVAPYIDYLFFFNLCNWHLVGGIFNAQKTLKSNKVCDWILPRLPKTLAFKKHGHAIPDQTNLQ